MTLEEQIIQDYTLKKVIDSKTEQPVGKKMKKMIETYYNNGEESKYSKLLEETCSTFKISSLNKDILDLSSSPSAFKSNKCQFK